MLLFTAFLRSPITPAIPGFMLYYTSCSHPLTATIHLRARRDFPHPKDSLSVPEAIKILRKCTAQLEGPTPF